MNEAKTVLFSGGREVESIFELFGSNEDDISQAIAWLLKESPHFLSLLMNHLGFSDSFGETIIHFQRHESVGDKAGRTDIEIASPGRFHIILEAKRGWILPELEQLEEYAKRRTFAEADASFKLLVSFSECSAEYAAAHLPAKEIGGVLVQHVSWADSVSLARLAHDETSATAEKRLLKQLLIYLGKIMRPQRVDSSQVYVVSLGTSRRPGWTVNWIDIVEKHQRYFHPLSGTWPKEPPAYIAFRYRGQLQSIHFIERYRVIHNLQEACEGIADSHQEPAHYLYHLGPAIRPSKTVKTGNIWPNGRVWAAIDLLLTCDTVAEARDRTKDRLRG
jgi:hypothetical protein